MEGSLRRRRRKFKGVEFEDRGSGAVIRRSVIVESGLKIGVGGLVAREFG